MLPGYNTNGFPHHRLSDAITILSELGYRSVAITLTAAQLEPPDRGGVGQAVEFLQRVLARFDVHVTIETGDRFILDSFRKHQPTLLSASAQGRQKRLEFLKASIDIAAALAADSVSLWSGAADDEAGETQHFSRLVAGLGELLDYAQARGIRLSFEPEPGMFIDTMDRFARLMRQMNHPLLGLTLDVGHVHCLSDGEIADHASRWRDRLWNVHIEDMRRGVHEHLMFGEGGMDFRTVFESLRAIDYAGPLHVELPRHGHDAVEIARRSYEFMQKFLA